jgi:type VI secretion system secreted protein VgrG
MSAAEPLRYVIDLGGRAHEAREVEGRERVSTPFRLDVRFVVDDARLASALDPEALAGEPVALRLERGGRVARSIDGVATEVAIGASARGAHEVHVVVEPRLALARHRRGNRVFRDRTVPEIVVEVLAAIGVRPELRLREVYAQRPYVVELHESDLDFVERLLEDEGIFYFFLAGDVLVLGDSPAAYDELDGGPLPFGAASGLALDERAVVLGQRAALTAGRVTLRDFNVEHPSLDMDVHADVPGPVALRGAEMYDFPGEYQTPGEGARRAALVAEALACGASAVIGESTAASLVLGGLFEVADAPVGIDDGRLVVLALEHAWRRDASSFALRFEALPAALTYRPPRVTEAPRLASPVTGVVTGPPGQDVHVDALGRVKVRFFWDREQPYDDACSDWVPVLQDNTGSSVVIPRVGWEVLVGFLEGDPDRPVVLGRLYNGADPFPEPLPEGRTRSALRSLSSPSREGANVIRFDDLAGREELFVQAERDQTVVVANDRDEQVLRDERTVVKRDQTIAVGTALDAAIGADLRALVEGRQRLAVAASRSEWIGASSSASVAKDHVLTIGGVYTRRIGTDDVVSAGDLSETVGAAIVEASLQDNRTSSGATMALVVGGALVEVAKDGMGASTGGARAEVVGGVLFSKAGAVMTTEAAAAHVTTVGGAWIASAAKALTLKGGVTARLSAGATGALTGATSVTLRVGDSSVVLADGAITLTAGSEIRVVVDGDNALGADESAQI